MAAAADHADDPLAAMDSACSTPFVSAPSSPTRDHYPSHGACFFSAPASPARGAGSSEFAGCGLESFDFDFSSRFPSPSAAAMSSADELFCNGQIRPVRLSAMLLQPHQPLAPTLAHGDEMPSHPLAAADERGRIRSRSVHRKSRSLSPFRAHWSRRSPSPAPEPEFAEPLATPAASRSSSSSSTASSASATSSRGSRRWGFLKDLLHRSKSDGGKTNRRTDPTISAPAAAHKASASPAAGRGRGRKRSAHERLYEARRAEAEEMRRRTYLPYRQQGLLLFGCIGLGNRVNGLARGLNTAAAAARS